MPEWKPVEWEPVEWEPQPEAVQWNAMIGAPPPTKPAWFEAWSLTLHRLSAVLVVRRGPSFAGSREWWEWKCAPLEDRIAARALYRDGDYGQMANSLEQAKADAIEWARSVLIQLRDARPCYVRELAVLEEEVSHQARRQADRFGHPED